MLEWIIDIISKIFVIILIGITPFIVMSAWYYIYYVFIKKTKKPIKKIVSEYKRPSILKRLFIHFPKRFVKDLLDKDPNEFGEYGLHLFVGEQGSGKTVATVEFLRRLKYKYPLCKIATNFEYKYEDNTIDGWQNLVFNNNGIYGQVDVIDEVQNWFSSNQSKDFPPEMIQEITQQRKQRKILIGTTQRFERMSKPLREQVNYIYYPMTFAGCLTIVKVCKPSIDSDGQIKKLVTKRHYFFIHDDEIRNSFDTYHKIKKQAESGFISDNNKTDTSINVYNVVDTKAKRKK